MYSHASFMPIRKQRGIADECINKLHVGPKSAPVFTKPLAYCKAKDKSSENADGDGKPKTL